MRKFSAGAGRVSPNRRCNSLGQRRWALARSFDGSITCGAPFLWTYTARRGFSRTSEPVAPAWSRWMCVRRMASRSPTPMPRAWSCRCSVSSVDPGPGSTLETLQRQLQARGIGVGDLEAILLTHIHLDHAGATGSLVRENPRLAVYVHKNGAPHVMDPSKLLASAQRLWPNELQFLFGETLPVPAENLRILEGGENLTLGSRQVEVVYTPGHASHHVSYFDKMEGVAFVGDTAGVRIEGNSYVMPATHPPDIDLEIWDASFAAILERKPARLFLTHFGYSDNPS